MNLLGRNSLRKLFFVLAGVLGCLYLLSFYGHVSYYDLGHLTDVKEPPPIAKPVADQKDAYRNSELSNKNYKRLQSVRQSMEHAWQGYRQYAWGQDELQPLTKTGNQKWGGWAITAVDSLDTLKLMGMEKEYQEAKEYVRRIRFDQTVEDKDTMVFEMVIRGLGGLLGAYEMDNDPMYLAQAKELADKLILAFESTTGVPYQSVNVNSGTKSGNNPCIAEAGTVQLEYMKLSQLTKNPKYRKLAERASDGLERGARKHKGLYPIHFDATSGKYLYSEISVGGMGDSFYEYQLKQYVLHDGKQGKYKDWYVRSVEAVKEKLVRRNRRGWWYLGSLNHDLDVFTNRMEHLACYFPGLMALGAKWLDRPQDLKVAEELARTCYQSYKGTKTGLGPEAFQMQMDEDAGTYDKEGFGVYEAQYILRPETLESLFVLYRVTGDPKYQDWGWEIYLAIEKHCRTAAGYAAYGDVRKFEMQTDSMESFFLAETLKYLYLLFGPRDVWPLDKYVLNTEAHPLKIIK